MQPYFFPHLGYFDLIQITDQWVVFDTPQYIRHGWLNRNRILHPNEGWQYIIAPLTKHDRFAPISSISVSSDGGWREKILRQLHHYKKNAVHYQEAMSLVERCLSFKEQNLSRLNVMVLAEICRYLELEFQPEFLSDLKLGLGPIEKPGDWALEISKSLKANEYINPPGGKDLFNAADFEAVGVKLTIRDMAPMKYHCKNYEYVARLSIIDVLMWNSRSEIRKYLFSPAVKVL